MERDIHAAEEELRKTSLLQFSQKSKLQERISTLQAEKTDIEQKILDFERRINVVSTIIGPVDKNIEIYSSNLYRIVEKYKYII